MQRENHETETAAEPSTAAGGEPSGLRDRAAGGLRERLGLSRELTWESARGKLQQTQGKLREPKNELRR